MLEEKQGRFWNMLRIPNKTSNPDFRFFLGFSGLKISNCNFIWKSSTIKKDENQDSKFCAEFDAYSKLSLFFF